MNSAFVKIWGEVAGAVSWSDTGVASFEYDRKFVSKRVELSPIKMPSIRDRIYDFSQHRDSSTFKGLPGLLADALPDKYGTALIDSWLASQGRTPGSMNPVERLCFIGARAMGALEFEPSVINYGKRATNIEIESLVEAASLMLRKKQDFETNINNDEQKAMRDILKLGTSAGGARAKAIIAWNEKSGQIKSGQADAPEGFEHWLIKLDGVKNESLEQTSHFGRIEMAYHLMAKESGIDMTECRLYEEGGRAHFMTKRFDREGAKTKHHIQTFCAMEHFDYENLGYYSYEQLFATMRALRLPYPDFEQMFRRMVFNVLAQNNDDHTKNHSFILKEGGVWRLSPAYDVCYAYNPNNNWVSQHPLTINGKRKDISKEDFLAVADNMGINNGTKIVSEITNAVGNWIDFASMTNVNAKYAKEIEEHIMTE